MLILILEPGLGPKISTKGKTCLSSFKAWLKKKQQQQQQKQWRLSEQGLFSICIIYTLFRDIEVSACIMQIK